MNLESLFNPKKIAVIGAADNHTKLGYILFNNLLSLKKGKVYPVNPVYKKVQGKKCFNSVKEIKEKIDLVVIAVKPEIVSIVLKECGEKNIPFAVIITAGYKEIGLEGEKKEKELIRLAKHYKINLVGPNCLGIMNTAAGLNATFGNTLPKEGKVAFISQSGALGTAMLDWAEIKGIGFSKFISLGNAAGLQENDFIEYLANDKNTSAIVLYLEGLSDGKRFVKLCRKITPKKPIVVIKAGKSEKGAQAISSHTGSLAPSFEIFKVACQQAGVILVDSLKDIFNIISLFNINIKKLPNEWVIVTNGGGPSIITTDLLENSKNLSLFKISNEIKKILQKKLPNTAALDNPIDLVGDALEDRYENTLKELVKIKKDFGIITLLTPQKVTPVLKISETISNFKNKKIIFPLFIGGKVISEAEDYFTKNGLVNFSDPSDLVKTISLLAPIKKIKSKKITKNDPSKNKQKSFSFNEINSLFSKYNLKLVGEMALQKNDLNKLAKKINFPWAMKLISSKAIHKTESGVIKTNIKNLKKAKLTWDEILKNFKIQNPHSSIDGLIVQPMVQGVEVIIGIKRDDIFGPVIVFGLGGIYTEIIKDISMRLCPVSESEALAMINELKSSTIFYGARGKKPLNVKLLAKIISTVSVLAQKEKNIKELDINPAMVTSHGVKIVDTRILID